MLIESTLLDSSSCATTITSAFAAFSDKLINTLRCSLKTLAARLKASSGVIVPLVNISRVSLSKSVSWPTRVFCTAIFTRSTGV